MDSVKCWQTKSVIKTMSVPSCLLCHSAKCLTHHPEQSQRHLLLLRGKKRLFGTTAALVTSLIKDAAHSHCSGVGTLSLAKDKGRKGQFLSPCSKAPRAVSSSQLWAKLVPSASLSSIVWVVIAEVFGYVTGCSENPDYGKWSSSKIKHTFTWWDHLCQYISVHMRLAFTSISKDELTHFQWVWGKKE